LSPTPTLPVAGAKYVGAASPGCFAKVGVCLEPGSLAGTSVTGSTFDASGQHISIDAVYTSEVTDLSHTPIGTLSLTGEIDESVDGRTGPTDIGTWTTGLDKLDLSGTVLGDPVTVALDPSNPSTGTTSITPTGSEFLISSFFDVFVDITIDTGTGPLMVSKGPLRVNLEPLPEPATILLLMLPLAGLFALRGGADRPALAVAPRQTPRG
jgi:hypothetical protein